MAYVATDAERGRSHAATIIGAKDFERMDVSLDVIDDDGSKTDEMHLSVSFAAKRSFEIVEARYDPCGLWNIQTEPGAETTLKFHHVGSFVGDLAPAIAEARSKNLTVLQLKAPGMDVAFINLGPLGGPWLEMLSPHVT